MVENIPYKMKMKKLAIIGASYLQEPLIRKAKSMGIITYVFAWAANDVGEKIADYFYPISIVEKEEILIKCQEIGIDGICSIASDLAVVTVNYVAEKMGLIGNSMESTLLSTNKHNMRRAFEENGDPSPRSITVQSADEVPEDLRYPVIVKPLDRSGSRGIFKLFDSTRLNEAITEAENQGFIKNALVEEFVEGTEYSVECISYKGQHHFLAMTLKYTTGSPHFIETGHIEPAPVEEVIISKVKKIIFHALNSLKIQYGASHSEIKIDQYGNVKIIEIGARMGGDFIGSSLVQNSTGIDYVKAVIDIALGEQPSLVSLESHSTVGIHFICTEEDIASFRLLEKEHPEYLIDRDIPNTIEGEVKDSSSRFGYFIMKAPEKKQLERYMPSLS